MKKNQKGYTLMEMMMVITIMVMISISVMEDLIAESAQVRARTLGVEISEFARGLSGFVGYYAGVYPGGIDPMDSPGDGDVIAGVNFLKNGANCSASETTSAGDPGAAIGFIANCSFLSNLIVPARDEATTYGHLKFETTFTRTLTGAGSNPFGLEAITYVDAFQDANAADGSERFFNSEMGTAALIAGGFNPTVGNAIDSAYSVYFCVTEVGTSAEYTAVCAGNVNKIAIVVNNDASTSTWLRTDGSNTMNASIEFRAESGPGTEYLQAIENLKSIVLTQNDGTIGAGKLAIGTLIGDPIFELDETSLSLHKGALLVLDADGFISVNDGYIYAKEEIISESGVESPVYLPYSDNTADTANNSDYRMIIDGDTELKDIGVKSVSFGLNPGASGRAQNGSNASLNTGDSGKGIDFRADNIYLSPLTDSNVKLKGNAQVGGFQIAMSDGRYKSLADLLPRYQFLGATSFSAARNVYKSTYTALGCRASDLKIIVVPQSHRVASTFSTNALLKMRSAENAMNMGTVLKSGYHHIFNGYALRDVNGHAAYGNSLVDVRNYSDRWYVRVYTNGAASSGNAYRNTFVEGSGIAQIYCYNSIDRRVLP